MDKSYRPRYDDNQNKRKKPQYGSNQQGYNDRQGYNNQGYSNTQNYNTQGFNTQSNSTQNYNTQNFSNTQGYNTQNYGNQSYSNQQSYANRQNYNRSPQRSRRGYDDGYTPRRRKDKEKGPLGGILIFLFILAVIAGGGWFGFKAYNGEMGKLVKNEKGLVDLEIPKGANTESISKLLQQKGLVEYPVVFRILSKINSFDGRYKVGKHTIKPGITYEEMMAELVKPPKIVDLKLMIPPGFTVKQIIDKIAASDSFKHLDKDKLNEALKLENYDMEFLNNIPKESLENRKYQIEGYLYPETYFVSENWNEVTIIKRLLEQYKKVVYEDNKAFEVRAKELGYTMDEIMIIASLIERETKVADEAATISGVIHKRLKNKLRLELCSTIQYISICNGGEVKEHLLDEDTKVDDIYNTYAHNKLPPGPICSPGLNAIKAALYPDDQGYLYFVAKGDGSGGHYFAKTLYEHNVNKRKYQANLAKLEKAE